MLPPAGGSQRPAALSLEACSAAGTDWPTDGPLSGVWLLPVLLTSRAALLAAGPREEFGLRLAGRSFLLLRGRYGYVGSVPGHEVLRCDLLEPDCIELLPCKAGVYHLQSE